VNVKTSAKKEERMRINGKKVKEEKAKAGTK